MCESFYITGSVNWVGCVEQLCSLFWEGAFPYKFSAGLANREKKSLSHVAMVTKIFDDNKPKKSLKSIFALL